MLTNKSNRRDFLRNTTGLLGISFTGIPFDFKKRTPLLSFSTLGCPDWSFADTVKFAKAHGYQGLEIRGIKRELDLPKCPEFSSPENIRSTCKLVADNGLVFADLGSSASLHYREGAEREKSLRARVQQLEIMVDRSKLDKQVSEIVDSDFFQELQTKVRGMRDRFNKDEE